MSQTLHTPLCALLGIRLPIIQAPMAGGPASPALVAAVARAGALGSFGFAFTPPDVMHREVAELRASTSAPFALNLFGTPQPGPLPAERQRGAIEAVSGFYAELGLPPPEPVAPPYAPDLDQQLAAAETIRPAVLTMHLGALSSARIRRFQALGVRVGATATCVAEGEALDALGVDFIVAQGAEAGGHRGTYLCEPSEAMAGTLALVRLIVRRVNRPVVAAGGIMDGEGIAAALALGAQAAQLGTAFVPCPESGAPEVHKQGILAAREDTTGVTDMFSGKPARALANRFLRDMAERHAPRLPFPAQNALTARLRAAAARSGNPELYALWAGQAAPLARALPAGELIAALEAEALAAISRLAALAG